MKTLIFIFGAFLLLGTVGAKVPLMNQEIGEAIFQQNKPYLIYMAYHINSQIMEVFEEYCTSDKLCTYLDGSEDMYTLLTSFVGMKTEQYLLILDGSKFEKFTLEIDEKVTVFDIMEFESSFRGGTLDRHYTSEEIPAQSNDPHLQKVVGLTFQDFIEGQAQIKVLYLYSDDEGCSNCQKVYEIMVEASKKYPNRGEVVFGALDLFRNDHKLLNQQQIPVVLVYTTSEEMLRLKDIEQIQQLEKIISENLRQVTDL